MKRTVIAFLALAMFTPALFAQGPPQQGPVIVPKKAPDGTTTTPAPPATTPAPPPNATQPLPPDQQKPQYNYTVNAPEIQIPVTVQTDDGQFIPGLAAQQFHLTEDGVPQTLSKVALTNQAPVTVVILVEFRNIYPGFIINALRASYAFTSTLQPHDWVALVSYDLKDNIVVDFTQNKEEIYQGLNTLRFPVFTTGDLFDALTDTVTRLDQAHVQGRKIVLLITTGFNSFSHITFDDVKKDLNEQQSVSVFGINTDWVLEAYSNGGNISMLQAQTEMRYMCETTGGLYWEPRFEGQFPDIFHQVAEAVRNEYILSYAPTNKALDGTVRHVKVQVVGPDGTPLKVTNQKGKTVKYTVQYRDTYTSRHIVE